MFYFPALQIGISFSNKGITETFDRRKIRLIESNAKCRRLKKLTCKGTLRKVFICLRPLPFLGFCLRWSSNFVGSQSGQIQSGNKLLRRGMGDLKCREVKTGFCRKR
jgi:hypothetical protein